MELFTAPQPYKPRKDRTKTLFLAGGISNCPDWQSRIIELLSGTELVLLNPRRPDFDVTDESSTVVQIVWEHTNLLAADAILFWFPAESVCPITLYELGRWTGRKTVFVGMHPDYTRCLDVKMQTRLELTLFDLPHLQFVYSLTALAEQVLRWAG